MKSLLQTPRPDPPAVAFYAWVLLLLGMAAAPLARGDLVTYFNFNNPDRASSDGGQPSTLTSDFSGVFESPGTSLNALFDDPPGEDLTLFSGQAGVNNGRSIQFNVSTLGLSGLSLSYATRASAEGFASQTLSYSINGGTFIEIGSVTPQQGEFALRSFDLSSVTEIEDQASVTFRITFTQGSTTNVFEHNRLDNLQLTTPQSVPPGPGNYRGVVKTPQGITGNAANAGLAQLKLTPKARLSGVLQLGGKSYRFKGVLDSSGIVTFGKNGANLPLPRKGLDPLILRMHTGTKGQITGEIRNGDATFAQFSGQPDGYDRHHPVPSVLLNPEVDKGNYTAAFVAQPAPNGGLSAQQFPQGDGWAILRLKPSGAVKMRGQLADGTKFTYASVLSAANDFPFYIPLYKRKGAVAGRIAFNTGGSTQLETAGLAWFRPPQSESSAYPDGWPNGITLGFDGAARNIVTEPNVLPVGNATLSLTGGNLAPAGLTKTLTIEEGNHVTIAAPDPEQTKIKLKPNGQWIGSFVHPVSGHSTNLQGVVLRNRMAGAGFFIGTTESGLARIDPQP